MKCSSLSFIFCFALFIGCQELKEKTDRKQSEKGSFGFDLEFISSHTDVVILRDKEGKACLITTPELQGTILTSSLDGLEGKSLGYVNHKRIASKEIVPHA
jgi:hypothetical protein